MHKYDRSWVWELTIFRTYKAIADSVGKNGYRGDLNQTAIARASAILDSQRPKPDAPEKKPRGVKAKKAAA